MNDINETDPDLEQDIFDNFYMRDRLHDDRRYAAKLYSALCNMQWQKQDVMPLLAGSMWSCSWRTAGAIVAKLRGRGENYLDFYCGGNEGVVDPEIEYDLGRMDWKPLPYDDEDF
jgi:hypothetical protein